MSLRIRLLALPLTLWALEAGAEPTLELYIRGAKEVFEGDPVSTTVDARGRVELGLEQSVRYEGPGRPAVAFAARGHTLFVATAGAGLLRLPPRGEPEVIARGKDQAVSAVGVGERAVWLATAPGAQVSRWSQGRLEPVRKLEASYVWALVPEREGTLVATGKPGQLLRLSERGVETLYRASEGHIRTVARHPRRGLVVGTGEEGRVYQLGDEGAARALYDSKLDEVTALAVDPVRGDLYAAVVSASKKGALDPGTWIGPVGDDPPPKGSPFEGSEVVRIRPTGDVERVWSSKDEGALALAVDPERGRVLVVTGTGPKGRSRVYAVETENRDRVVLLARLAPALGTAARLDPDGRLLVATAPDGAVFALGPEPRAEGVYRSVKQDLRRVARVGRLWFDADVPAGGRVEVRIRTGNTSEPDESWSNWSAPVREARGGAVDVPRGRYAQLEARLRRGRDGSSPRLRSMHASVRRANLPPSVTEVYPLRPGLQLRPIPAEHETEKTVSLSSSVLKRLRRPKPRGDERLRVRAGAVPGMRTLAWTAVDPNGDELIFDVELEPEGRPGLPLGTGLELPFVSFDGHAHPDGRYRLRVQASDRPSNAPEESLADERRSEVFVIDNTPPVLDELRLRERKAGLELQARAKDAMSRLGTAELSIDGGPWLSLPAADGLLDDFEERLRLGAGALPPASKAVTVRIRVTDEVGNATVATLSHRP